MNIVEEGHRCEETGGGIVKDRGSWIKGEERAPVMASGIPSRGDQDGTCETGKRVQEKRGSGKRGLNHQAGTNVLKKSGGVAGQRRRGWIKKRDHSTGEKDAS